MPIVVFDRPWIWTKISGRVEAADPLLLVPAGLEVKLMRQGEVLAKTQVQRGGKFLFLEDFKNGDYTIQVADRGYQGQQLFQLVSFEHRDILVSVTKLPGK